MREVPNIGEKYYFIVDADNEIFMSGVEVNEYNRFLLDVSNIDKNKIDAIKRYKLELFKEFDNKLYQLNELERSL